MPATIDPAVIRELIHRYMHFLTMGDDSAKGLTTVAENLIRDGRTRKSMFKALLKEGYLVATDGVTTITDKAFKEFPPEPVDLAALYTYDAYASDKGHVWVVWDRLSLGQKKTVLTTLQQDPTAYTLALVEDRHTPPKVATFGLGTEGRAMEQIGGWNSFRVKVLWNAAVQDKDCQCKRAAYIQRVSETGLNWFLHKRKLLPAEMEVPLGSRQPVLGGGPTLAVDSKEWPGDLIRTIQATKDRITAARVKLEALQRLEEVVADVGWEKFLSDYSAAVVSYVDQKLQPDPSPAGVPAN